MRCLAVQQPWAWAICAGFKRIENRSWKTPYRGPVAILASSKRAEGNRLLKQFDGNTLPPDLLSYSAIIGTADLVDVLPLSLAVESDPFATGPICWLFDRPKWFTVLIVSKGRLRLYELPAGEAEAVHQAVAATSRSVDNPAYAAFADSLQPTDFDSAFYRAENYLQNRQWPDLKRTIDRMLSLDPKQPEPYFFRAAMALFDNRPNDGIADFDMALDIDPKYAMAYIGRSDCHDLLGNEAAADADRAQAFELDPSLADPPIEAACEYQPD